MVPSDREQIEVIRYRNKIIAFYKSKHDPVAARLDLRRRIGDGAGLHREGVRQRRRRIARGNAHLNAIGRPPCLHRHWRLWRQLRIQKQIAMRIAGIPFGMPGDNRQVEFQCRLARHAFLAAREPLCFDAQARRIAHLCCRGHGDKDGQQRIVVVAEVVQPIDVETLRNGPADIVRQKTRGQRPFQLRRQARVARFDPVSAPSRCVLDAQAKTCNLAGNQRRIFTDQLDFAVFARHRRCTRDGRGGNRSNEEERIRMARNTTGKAAEALRRLASHA